MLPSNLHARWPDDRMWYPLTGASMVGLSAQHPRRGRQANGCVRSDIELQSKTSGIRVTQITLLCDTWRHHWWQNGWMVQAKSQESKSSGYWRGDSFRAGRQSTFNWRRIGKMVSGFMKKRGAGLHFSLSTIFYQEWRSDPDGCKELWIRRGSLSLELSSFI